MSPENNTIPSNAVDDRGFWTAEYAAGHSIQFGIHSVTDTMEDPHGYDINGLDDDGRDRDGYDVGGFDEDGIHRDTGTVFNRYGRTCEGDMYDSEGYDIRGYDSDGYDSDGYNESGFDCDGIHRDTGEEWDEEGYDCEGNRRGDCIESYVSGYGSCVIEDTNWRNIYDPKVILAGHEVEMYSRNMETSDVDEVLTQLRRAYAAANPSSHGNRCAIAKHDGSLDEGGFEAVTVPLTPEQTYAVFGSFDVLGNGTCAAWSRGNSCGHHIHISRLPLTRYTEGKIGVFMNMTGNRVFVEWIAQRPAQYNGFEFAKRIARPENPVRHSVLNVTSETLEFRIFKSNLRSSGILKNYEFCIATVNFCRQASHSRLEYPLFMQYVIENRSQYRYLHGYMASSSKSLGDDYRKLCPPSALPVRDKFVCTHTA